MKTLAHLHKRNRKEKGLSLIEIGIGLTLLAALIGGVLALFASTSQNQKSTQLISDLTALRGMVANLGYQTGTWSAESTPADLTSMIIQTGNVPSTLRTIGGNQLFHNFDGAMQVRGLYTRFGIELRDLPRGPCVAVLTSVSGYTKVIPSTGVSIANAAAAPAGNTTTGWSFPFSSPTVVDSNLCNNALNSFTLIGR